MRLKYPLAVVNGKLAYTEDLVGESNLSLLCTIRGERVYRPTYGSPVELFSIGPYPSYAEVTGSKVSINSEEI